MSTSRWNPGLAALYILLLSPSASGVAPSPKTRTFLAARPAMRPMVRNERLIALYGTPLAVDSDPATDTDAFVTSFLQQNGDALGVDDCVLELRNKINTRNDKFTVYTYRQKVEGLPVHGSVVKIPVVLGATEKIVYSGMHLVQHPPTPLPADVISAADAITVVAGSREHRHLTEFTAAEKVIYEAADGSLHRAWRFSGHGHIESYLFFVDTSSAEILEVQDQVIHGDVSGTVMGYGTLCTPPDHPTCPNCCYADNPENSESCPQQADMVGVQVSVVDGPVKYTGEGGSYVFFDLPDGQEVTVESRLIGEWVTVQNHSYYGLTAGPELTASEPAIPPQQHVDLVFNPTGDGCPVWPSEFGTAQVNVFLAVQDTHDWLKDLQPAFTAIDKNILCLPNVLPGTRYLCNAGYYPGLEWIIFAAAPDISGTSWTHHRDIDLFSSTDCNCAHVD